MRSLLFNLPIQTESETEISFLYLECHRCRKRQKVILGPRESLSSLRNFELMHRIQSALVETGPSVVFKGVERETFLHECSVCRALEKL